MLPTSTNFESIGATSSSLLERVKARDQDAWQRLVRLYGWLVLYWCQKANIPQADRAVVFGKLFRSVARHVAGFRCEWLLVPNGWKKKHEVFQTLMDHIEYINRGRAEITSSRPPKVKEPSHGLQPL
jgi:hypothetical protein